MYFQFFDMRKINLKTMLAGIQEYNVTSPCHLPFAKNGLAVELTWCVAVFTSFVGFDSKLEPIPFNINTVLDVICLIQDREISVQRWSIVVPFSDVTSWPRVGVTCNQ